MSAAGSHALSGESGNTSDASDIVCVWSSRENTQVSPEWTAERPDACTTYRRQLLRCFSLPLLTAAR